MSLDAAWCCVCSRLLGKQSHEAAGTFYNHASNARSVRRGVITRHVVVVDYTPRSRTVAV